MKQFLYVDGAVILAKSDGQLVIMVGRLDDVQYVGGGGWKRMRIKSRTIVFGWEGRLWMHLDIWE